MKKNIGDFKNRYGDDAKSVMYATATKLSQKESLQYVAGFDTSSNAYEFARKLKSYGIAEHIVIDKSVYINTVNVMFETGIDNESFVSWLCEHNIGTGISMMYENILPDPQHFTDPITRRTYTDFRQEKSSIVYDLMFKDALLPEAEDAYKKTRAYKKLKPDEKKAIDFFMSEVETQGINNLEKVYKQTTVRYSIKTSTLDAFMENIFFDEDIAYIKSIQTIISEEDKANTNAQKDMDAAKEKVDKDKETAETKKADTKKKSDERKAKSVEDTKAKTADADKSKEADAPEKTFKNFKSDLKPGQKGPPAITKNKDEEEVKMDKPVKGSPIDDSPEMDSGIDENRSTITKTNCGGKD